MFTTCHVAKQTEYENVLSQKQHVVGGKATAVSGWLCGNSREKIFLVFDV